MIVSTKAHLISARLHKEEKTMTNEILKIEQLEMVAGGLIQSHLVSWKSDGRLQEILRQRKWQIQDREWEHKVWKAYQENGRKLPVSGAGAAAVAAAAGAETTFTTRQFTIPSELIRIGRTAPLERTISTTPNRAARKRKSTTRRQARFVSTKQLQTLQLRKTA